MSPEVAREHPHMRPTNVRDLGTLIEQLQRR